MPDTPTDVPSFSVSVSGSTTQYEGRIISIQVTTAVNRIARARIELSDGSPSEEDFEISDSSDFVPGTAIEILAGYDQTNTSIFSGIVLGIGLESDEFGSSRLIVECVDKAIKMTIGTNTAYYADQTDSNIIGALISNASLDSDVTSTSYQWAQLIQSSSTDWDFMMSRAEVNGMIVVNSAGKVTVAAPETSDSGTTATYGVDMFSFRTKLDASTQLQGVQSESWDPSSQATVTATASEPSVPTQGNQTGSTLGSVAAPSTFNLVTTATIESDPLQAWADAQLLRSRLAMIRGSVTLRGDSSLAPNTVITLKGLGDRFNGSAYVSSVTHKLRDANWKTELETGLDAKFFTEKVEVTELPAKGLLPGFAGLYIGTVLQIDSDPDSESRIQINIPVVGEAGSGVWARIGMPYATAGMGIYFMPEVGDEVIVGFFNQDPRAPVILGSMYSSSNAPPYTADSDNTYKAIVTKSEVKVEVDDVKKILTLTTPSGFQAVFDEDSKKVTVETPGSRSITLDDDGESVELSDPNGGTVTMNSSGITLKSDQNITIQSSANVEIKGDGGVTVETSATLTLTGSSQVEIN